MIMLFENYRELKAKFKVDLFWLNERTKQNLGDPGDELSSWSMWLKRLDACSEFMNDPVFDQLLERTKHTYRKLFFVEWAIRSRQDQEKELLTGLFVNGETWAELGDRLKLSSSSISRLRKSAFDGIKGYAKEVGGWEDVVNFES